MNARVIEKLVEDVDIAASSNGEGVAHKVWHACNVLYEPLMNVDADNVQNPEVAANFIKARKVVGRWAKDIRGANIDAWESVSYDLKKGIRTYAEPVIQRPNGSFMRGLMGYRFVEKFGEKFVCELLEYYDASKEGDLIWKREKILTLWRFFESNRATITQLNTRFASVIGMLSNKFSIRHEDGHQNTDAFLEGHTERDYERLLDYLMTVMLTSFANLNFTENVEPQIKELLD